MVRQFHPVADLLPLLTAEAWISPPTLRRTGLGSQSCSTMVAARTAKWIENEAAERQRQGRRDLGANLRQGWPNWPTTDLGANWHQGQAGRSGEKAVSGVCWEPGGKFATKLPKLTHHPRIRSSKPRPVTVRRNLQANLPGGLGGRPSRF